MKRIIIFFALLPVISNCDLLQKEFMGRYGIKNCTFELLSVNSEIIPDYSNLYNSFALITFRIRVYNPNSYSVFLDRMVFDLLINEKVVLKDVENEVKRDIDPGASMTFGLSVKVTYKELEEAYKGLYESIKNRKADYKLIATVFFDTDFTSFSYKTTIKEGKI